MGEEPDQIIRAVLEGPISTLLPQEDLVSLLEPLSILLETDTESQLSKVYGKTLSDIKKAANNRDVSLTVTKLLLEYNDDELSHIQFRAPVACGVDDIEPDVLDLAGNERFLVANEDVSIISNAPVNDGQLNETQTHKQVGMHGVTSNKRQLPMVPRDQKKLKLNTETAFIKLVDSLELSDDKALILSSIDVYLYQMIQQGQKLLMEKIKIVQREAIAYLEQVKNSLSESESWPQDATEVFKYTRVYFLCLKAAGFGLEVVYDEGITQFVTTSKLIIDQVLSEPQLASSNKALIGDILPQILMMIQELIESINVSETIINTVLLANLNWLTTSLLLDLRLIRLLSGVLFTTSNLLKSIYLHYPNERDFLLKNLVETLLGITEVKPDLCTVPISGSTKLSVISYSLLSILQFVDVEHLIQDHKHFLAGNMTRDSFLTARGFEEAYIQKSDQYRTIIESFCETAKSGNRVPLEIFVGDVLSMSKIVFFPGCYQIVENLVLVLKYYLTNETLPQQSETSMIGLCGNICSHIFRDYLDNISLQQSLSAYQLKTLSSLKLMYRNCTDQNQLKFAYQYTVVINVTNLLRLHRLKHRSELVALYEKDTVCIEPNVLEFYSILLRALVDPENTLKNLQIEPPKTAATEFIPRFDDEKNVLLDVLIKAMSSSRIKTRAKSVNVLSKLLEYTSLVELSSSIHTLLPKMLHDSSPMVRDSVLDFFYSYLSRNREKVDYFYGTLTEFLSDDSVLVRKEALRIAKDFFDNVNSIEIKAQFLGKLLKRHDDEDQNIKTSVIGYLKVLLGKNLENVAPILIRTLKLSTRTSTDFENFLESKVFVKDGIDLQVSIRSLLQYLIDIALIEDNRSELVPDVLRLISVIVKCNGKIFPQLHLSTLQPYIFDTTSNSESFYYSMVILKYSLPHFTTLSDHTGESIFNYLLSKLSKFSVKEMHEVVPVLSSISKFQGYNTKLANVTLSSLKLMVPYIEKFQRHETAISDTKLVKLLHLIGCLGSYCSLNDQKQIFEQASLGLKPKESVTSLILKFLLVFNNEKYDQNTRAAAIRNILNICLTHPPLYTNNIVLQLIENELQSEKTSVRIQWIIIQNLYDFVRKEERESRLRVGLEARSSTVERLDVAAFNGGGDAYVNDGICSNLVQRFIGPIMRLCFNKDYEFAHCPVKFSKLVFSLGYENPKLCIPTFIGLEASRNRSIRRSAHTLLQELFSKHESLFESSYTEGIKLGVSYYQSNPEELFMIQRFLSSLYSIVSKTVTSRRRFIKAVLRTLDNYICPKDSENRAAFNRNAVLFIISNLARVPYYTLEELYLISQNISDILTHQGLDIYEEVKDAKQTEPCNRSIACISSEAIMGLLEFNNFLINRFGLDIQKISNLKSERFDVESRLQPKVIKDIVFTLNISEILLDHSDPTVVENILRKFIFSMHLYNTS